MTEKEEKKIQLYEKTNRILAQLLHVSALPTSISSLDFSNIEVLKNLFQQAGEDLTEIDFESVPIFYNFLKNKYKVKTFSHINHLDAFLRLTNINEFFVKNLGLQEAWILFVDTERHVKQLWLTDRVNSVVFPEADRDINLKRVTKLKDTDLYKKVIDIYPDLKNSNTQNDIDKLHNYRESFALYLVELNIKKAKESKTLFAGLKGIPAFCFLGDDEKLSERRFIEQKYLILLSTPEELLKNQKISDDLPFDDFILEAMLEYEDSESIKKQQLIFFSFPLDPVDLSEDDGHDREHGAIWSGFLKISEEELAWLNSGDSKTTNEIPDLLLWRISTLKIALNILGQPCLRKQLELEIRKKADYEHTKESHDKLMILQRPLDVLTRAFQSIQAEAQEMESILNQPETVLFNTHKLLFDLYIPNNEIKISPSLKIESNHHWASSVPDDQKRLAHAYAICRIFGQEKELTSCQTVDAVEATTQHVLKKAHRDGVHKKLIRLMCQLFLPHLEKEQRNANVFALIDSLADATPNIKGIVLDYFLKPVIFTPFKSFGMGWPRMAFEIAFYGDDYINPLPRITEDTLSNEFEPKVLKHLSALVTPFPQHAILGFIINFLKNSKGWTDINFIDDDLKNIQIEMQYQEEKRYDRSGRSQETDTHPSLQEYIRQAIKYKIEQTVSGDFLNAFGMLIRNGINVVADNPRPNDWCYIEPKYLDNEMMILGKVKELDEDKTPKAYERYFKISQEHDAEKKTGTIKIIWCVDLTSSYSEDKQSNNINKEASTALTNLIEDSESERSQVRNIHVELLKVALEDHREGMTGFREQLSDGKYHSVFCFIGDADNSVPDETQVLFLHWNANTEVKIRDFLNGPTTRNIILISSAGDPHRTDRDRWRQRYCNRVHYLENTNCWPLNADGIVEKIREILKKCRV